AEGREEREGVPICIVLTGECGAVTFEQRAKAQVDHIGSDLSAADVLQSGQHRVSVDAPQVVGGTIDHCLKSRLLCRAEQAEERTAHDALLVVQRGDYTRYFRAVAARMGITVGCGGQQTASDRACGRMKGI